MPCNGSTMMANVASVEMPTTWNHLDPMRPEASMPEASSPAITQLDRYFYLFHWLLSGWLAGSLDLSALRIGIGRKLRWKWNSPPIISDALKCISVRTIIQDVRPLRTVSIDIPYTSQGPGNIVSLYPAMPRKRTFSSIGYVCHRMSPVPNVSYNGPITPPICGVNVRMAQRRSVVEKRVNVIIQFNWIHQLNGMESLLSYISLFFIFFLETFRNCADIAIISNTGGGVPPIFVDQSNPYLLYYRDSRAPEQNNIFPLIVR